MGHQPTLLPWTDQVTQAGAQVMPGIQTQP
jgi:hypothetical protein